MRPAVVALVLLLSASGPAAAQAPPSANDPTAASGLRSLARRVSRSAEDASAAAGRARGASSAAGRELTARLGELARSARSLRDRVDRGATVRELDNELAELERTSARVEAALSDARARASVLRPYHDAVDAIVQIRAASAAEAAPARGAASSSPARAAAEAQLDQIRSLAHEADGHLSRASAEVDRFAAANPGNAVEVADAVDGVARDATELALSTDQARIDVAATRAAARQLLANARAADDLMQATNASPTAAPEWSQGIDALARLTQALSPP
ncbi:MAG TPA: hypothetical protein VKF32_15280 [Thermoanaerobaculia bacterium]|nr:hypothetical protein [Thermoanaerobaculia bacterium]